MERRILVTILETTCVGTAVLFEWCDKDSIIPTPVENCLDMNRTANWALRSGYRHGRRSPSGGGKRREEKRLAMALFKRLDRDGSGTLSRSEFESGFSFDKVNLNHDKSISQDEFLRAVVSARRGGAHVLTTAYAGNGAAKNALFSQYMLLAVQTGLPFIAFGLCDNLIMICAGDYIEGSIGRALALSTLCAAGLGNLMSE